MTSGDRHIMEKKTEEKKPKLKILFLNRAPNRSHMNDMSGLFEMSYMGPLSETKQADYDTLWVGPCVETKAPHLDWLVFCKCMEYRPDVIFVYGWWLHPDDEVQAGYTALFTFYLIRKLLKIKIVALLFDQAPHQFKTSDNLTRFCDFVFTHEHEDHFRNYSSFPEKHVVTIATIGPKLFHANPLGQRDIDLAFAGGVGGRYPKERSIGLAALRDSGLIVTIHGGRGPDQVRLSNEEYADVFKRSKIMISWSRHISGKWYQAKARIFETTLAGAMLLCEECKEVNRWFQPCVDYVPFSTTEELVERARYYLEHEEERLKIAVQGHRTAMTKYRADVMWGQMLQDMRTKSLYREAEAIEGLKRNASLNELRVARFFQRELQQYPQFDQSVIDAAVAIVEEANQSFMRKLHWHSWYMKSLRWRMSRRMKRLRGRMKKWRRQVRGLHWRILRKLLPSFITRDLLRSLFLRGKRFFR